MRWFWIDRFIEFESGRQAKAVKNVTMAEDHLHDHYPGFPVMPGSLMLEGMAQTGGILLGETHDFEHIVILAKVPRMTYHHWVRPGDQLVYTATLQDAREEGGNTAVTAHVREHDGTETLAAEGEIVFVHLDSSDPSMSHADQRNFVFESGLLDLPGIGSKE